MKKILFFFLSSFFSISFAGNITVGTMSYPVDTLAHYKFGPGSYYTALQLIDATKPLRVFFLEVDATNPFIS
ncbi:MAG: phosphodiester glycosidase family protein, partial [Paludibacter sp.]